MSEVVDQELLQAREVVVQHKPFTIREMTPDDMPGVLQVEADCYDFPWSEKVFSDCRESGYTCVVVELDPGADSGEADSSTSSESPSLGGHGIMMFGPDEAHVLNLCVVGALRRLGVARQLLRHLITLAAQHDAKEVFLEVRESNVAAIRLYESMGFNRIAVRSRYYDCSTSASGREDAMIYALTLY